MNAKLKKDADKVRAKMRAVAVPAVAAQHSAGAPALAVESTTRMPTQAVFKSKATEGTASAPRPPKRKVEEISGTQTGEEGSRPFKVTAHKGEEFQTEGALLEALATRWQGDASSTCPARVNFMGGYTVVLDPSVSSESRVEQLLNACKKETHIPIGCVRQATWPLLRPPHTN